MPAKRTLEFASRTDAVLALRADGLSTRAIANKLAIEPKTVTALERSAERPKRRQRPAEESGRTVVFPIDVLDGLKPHAERRGIHVNRLARLIVEHVVDDGIVDAVLDDGSDCNWGASA